MFFVTCETHSIRLGWCWWCPSVKNWYHMCRLIYWAALWNLVICAARSDNTSRILCLPSAFNCARFTSCWGTCDLQWDLCWLLTEGGISYLVVNCDSLRCFCCGTQNLPPLLDCHVLWSSVKGLLKGHFTPLMPLSWEEETEWDICLPHDGPKFSTDSGLPLWGTNISGEIYADGSLLLVSYVTILKSANTLGIMCILISEYWSAETIVSFMGSVGFTDIVATGLQSYCYPISQLFLGSLS